MIPRQSPKLKPLIQISTSKDTKVSPDDILATFKGVNISDMSKSHKVPHISPFQIKSIDGTINRSSESICAPERTYLGEGSYGTVYLEDDEAVKRMKYIPDVIQEYVSLKYLSDVENVIKVSGYDLDKLEIRMKYYSTNLRKWLFEHSFEDSQRERYIIARDICMGLADVHSKGLTHADIKPSNILIQDGETPRAYLGDLGFVSVSKYVKANLTANIFRDPTPKSSPAHDIYSLGILLFELLGNVILVNSIPYDELHEQIDKNIENTKLKRLLLAMTCQEHEKRPNMTTILKYLFNYDYCLCSLSRPTYHVDKLDSDLIASIKEKMITICRENNINRPQRGYHALLEHLNFQDDLSDVEIYVLAMTLILASMFGNPKYDERVVLAQPDVSLEKLVYTLKSLIDNPKVIAILMYP